MTAPEQPQGDVARMIKLLRTPGIGAMWGPPPFEDAADLLTTLAAEVERLREEKARIERETVERCAKVAEMDSGYVSDHPDYGWRDRAVNNSRKAIAKGIRALTSEPKP